MHSIEELRAAVHEEKQNIAQYASVTNLLLLNLVERFDSVIQAASLLPTAGQSGLNGQRF